MAPSERKGARLPASLALPFIIMLSPAGFNFFFSSREECGIKLLLLTLSKTADEHLFHNVEVFLLVPRMTMLNPTVRLVLTKLFDIYVSCKVKSHTARPLKQSSKLAVFLTILVVFDLPFAKTDHDVSTFNKVMVSWGPRQLL